MQYKVAILVAICAVAAATSIDLSLHREGIAKIASRFEVVRPEVVSSDGDLAAIMRTQSHRSHGSKNGVSYDSYDGIPRDVYESVAKAQPVSHPDIMKLRIRAFGQEHMVSLTRNREFVAKDVRVYTVGKDGKLRVSSEKPNVDCYYKGHVDSDPSSFVAISTCEGVRGVIRSQSASLHIMPAAEYRAATLARNVVPFLDSEHIVIRDQDKAPRGKCDVKRHPEIEAALRPTGGSTSAPNAATARARTSETNAASENQQPGTRTQENGNRVKYVELMLVNDKQHVDLFPSTYTSRLLDVANHVNTQYGYLDLPGYSVHTVVTVIVHNTGSDPWGTPTMSGSEADSGNLLTKFSEWRAQQLQAGTLARHDDAHLLSGYDFNGGTIGLAWLTSMCSDLYAASVNQARDGAIGSVSDTVAHEMGHNFGMEHTTENFYDSQNCGANNQFVMNAFASTGVTANVWSSCSRKWASYFFDGYPGRITPYGSGNTPMCLENVPSVSASCGNGIVEGGEQCDCGSDCDRDPCCNGNTCQLNSGSSCSLMSPCCSLNGDGSTCSFAPASTVCRPSRDSTCDTAEQCTGSSANCPADSYAATGTSCSDGYSGTGICYKGGCQSENGQCHAIATLGGPTDYVGPCTHAVTFNKCGMLYCYEDGQPSSSCFLPASAGSARQQKANGTPCGSGMACWNSTCVTYATLDASGAPNNGRGGSGSGQGSVTVDVFPAGTGPQLKEDDDKAFYEEDMFIAIVGGTFALVLLGKFVRGCNSDRGLDLNEPATRRQPPRHNRRQQGNHGNHYSDDRDC